MSKYLKTKFDDFVKLNENKESLILYHGSKSRFDHFDDSKIGTGEGSGLFGDGFYLTDNKEVADFYGKVAAKKDKIVKVTHDGILGSPINHYSDDADDYAQTNSYTNSFKVDGNILDCKNFIIDEYFQEFIVQSYMKHSGWGDSGRELVEHTFKYLKSNKHKIRKFRGELEYVIKQVAFEDKKILEDIIYYIKKSGYDGVKYESDDDFEGSGSWNYVIYNKACITPIK